MAKQISWLSVDSAMPHDPKLSVFPDNDYRWTWTCLLCLEKRGDLEGQDVTGFAYYCHIEAEKFQVILEALQSKGLLNEDFRPRDFDEWQKRQQGRERAQRHRDKITENNAGVTPRNAPVTQNERDSTQNEPSYTETETERKRGGREKAVPPSDSQKRMVGEMATERSTTIEAVCQDLGFKGLTSGNITRVKNHLRSLKPPSTEDLRKQEMQAKTAAYEFMWEEVEGVFEAEGSEAARKMIREQDSKAHGYLWGRFTKLHPEGIKQEAAV